MTPWLRQVVRGIATASVVAGLLLAASVVGVQDVGAGNSAAAEKPPLQADEPPPQLRESDIPALPGLKIEGGNASEPPAQGPAAPPPSPSAAQGGGLAYVVRPGDSLSAIAQLYGVNLDDIALANHRPDDTVLRVGETLRIPNPFAAQVRRLESTLQQLGVNADAARHKEEADQAKIQALTDQVGQLKATTQELEHGVRSLPWWRGLAVTAGAAALLMLGVTALTMLEWLVLRRRFYALADMNEAIRRLDQKYRVALAKSELRLQQLYGRRRLAAEDQEKAKLSPEEIEIDRLNQQLKELLKEHLERLGMRAERARRRNRLRDLLGGVESLAEERAGRR